MKAVSRSAAAGKIIMPPTANMVSGNTSVWVIPARVATRSATLPGAVEACAVNPSSTRTAPAVSTTTVRSPMSRTPSTAMTRIAPCRNSAGRSTAIAPTAASRPAPVSRYTPTSATNAATSPPTASVTWVR